MDEILARMEQQMGPNEDTEVLLYALASIAMESQEVDTVRVAMVALYETEAGRAFLSANPMKI